jgi:hypothetical protein
MARYRCYFIGSDGQLVGAETIVSESDDNAIVVANRLYAAKAFASGFELWQGEHQVIREEIKAS